jgi:hypothetical protein
MTSKANAAETDLDGVVIRILGYDDIIKNKPTLGRAVDRQEDVEELGRRRNNHKGSKRPI